MRGHWMKSATFYVLMLGVSLVACDSSTTKAPASVDHRQAAVDFVDMLVAGEFGKAAATFDATMSKALPEAKLREAWEGVVEQAGAFRSRGDATVKKEAGFDSVYVPCVFEKASLKVKVVYDKAGRVSGLWFN